MIDYSILLLIVAASLSSIGGMVFGLYSDKIFSLGSLIKRQKQKKELHDSHIQEENENGDESNQIDINANNNENNLNNDVISSENGQIIKQKPQVNFDVGLSDSIKTSESPHLNKSKKQVKQDKNDI